MNINKQIAEVYFSPSAGRRYLTKRAAIQAEARAIILAKYPKERADYEDGRMTYPGWSLKTDEPERYEKLLKRIARILTGKFNGKQ